MWPGPERPPRRATPGEILGWGLFTSAMAAGLTALSGAGVERAGMLGGLGLAATAVLWLAARSGDPTHRR